MLEIARGDSVHVSGTPDFDSVVSSHLGSGERVDWFPLEYATKLKRAPFALGFEAALQHY